MRMSVWKSIGFRYASLALAAHSFCSWMLIAAIPLLVAERFGGGGEIVGSIALRLAPRLFLSPAAALAVRKLGPRSIIAHGAVLITSAILGLIFVADLFTFQLCILALGCADALVSPALLTLRAMVIPDGLNMRANTVFQTIDRFSKIFGPVSMGALVVAIGMTGAMLFLAMGQISVAILVLAVGRVWRSDYKVRNKQGSNEPPKQVLWRLARDHVFWALILPALGYMISLGALQPFLFWLNQDRFGADSLMWTALLAAQGLGAFIGGILASSIAGKIKTEHGILTAYLLASLVEALATLALAFAPNHGWALSLLVIGGIPEMIATAAYFTIVQQRWALRDQAIFYALTLPTMDLFVVVGVLSGEVYSSGLVSLRDFWLGVVAFAVLPTLPFLLTSTRGSPEAGKRHKNHND